MNSFKQTNGLLKKKKTKILKWSVMVLDNCDDCSEKKSGNKMEDSGLGPGIREFHYNYS